MSGAPESQSLAANHDEDRVLRQVLFLLFSLQARRLGLDLGSERVDVCTMDIRNDIVYL